MNQPNQKGFTLIEMLIAVAIVGILAAIALPSYQQHVIRSNRSAAQSQMMEIANREQQFLLSNRTYANKATLAVSYTLPSAVSSKYTYDVVPGAGAVPSYLITFTPTGTQVSDGVLTLSSEGVKIPADKW